MMAGPTETSLCELVADGRRRTILLWAPLESLRIRPPLDIATASAIALGDMTGGDVGALDGGMAGSGSAMVLGREDDRACMAVMASGDDLEGIFVKG
jgi:hypothetical protein